MTFPLPDPPTNEEWTLAARWVFPVDGPPLPNGCVTIRDDRIVAVEPAGSRTPDLWLENAALLPGLVNVHTHLDLSHAHGKSPPHADFPTWLRRVGAHRRAQSEAEVQTAIEAGITQCRRHGTTLVGDISAAGRSWGLLSEAPIHAVVFYEFLGLTMERAQLNQEAMRTWLRNHQASVDCRPAFSLHAPYSVRNSVFEEMGEGICDDIAYPIAIHVAESEAEVQLLRDHAGPFVPFLESMGVWDPSGLVRDAGSILANDTPRSLFIHGNYLPATTLITKGTLVYCPRTHAAFGHRPHPFREFLKQGTRVVLATDSLASNPDLNVLAEARFVHERYLDVPGETLLRMITLSGAEALGWANETGSLTAGKSADMVVLPIEGEAEDAYNLIFKSKKTTNGTLFRGMWVA